MGSVYGTLSNAVSGVSPWSVAGVCARSAALAIFLESFLPTSIQNTIQKGLSKLFVIESPIGAVGAVSGGVVKDIFGKNSFVKLTAQVFAIVGDSSRFVERTVKIEEEKTKLREAINGKCYLYKQEKFKLQWQSFWIPPFAETWFCLHGKRTVFYMINVAHRCSALAWEMLGQAVALNNLITTLMWTEDAKDRNVDHIVCNFIKIFSFLTSDGNKWKEYIAVNKEPIETALKLMGSPMSIETFSDTVEMTLPVIKTLNFVKQKSSNFFGKGFCLVARSLGLGAYVPSPDRLSGYSDAGSASPFRDYRHTQALLSPPRDFMRQGEEDALRNRKVARRLFPDE